METAVIDTTLFKGRSHVMLRLMDVDLKKYSHPFMSLHNREKTSYNC